MLADRRIVIDASMATGGGGFTYVVNILPALSALAPGARFLVLLRSAALAAAISPLPNVELRVLPERGLLGKMAFLALRTRRIIQDWGADLYFSVGEYAALGSPCPIVVSFRNSNIFTPLDLGWGFYQRFRLPLLRFLALFVARRAQRVVFVSDDSARWMGDAAGIPVERRIVIHHGIDVQAWRARAQGKSPPRPPGILAVSSIYRYKNFARLIDAYSLMARELEDPPALTIVGDDQDALHSREMESARERAGDLAGRIHFVGAVPYEEVAAYYMNAKFFVFPSYLETFGHPLLEALAAGLPVVASEMPVFREIADEAAIYVDPHDTGALAAGMLRILEEDNLADTLVARGQERLQEFTWRSSATRLAEMIDDVVTAG